MRVVITGGAGFIGSNFVRKVSDGAFKEIESIVVLDKLTYAGSLDNLKGLKREDYEFIEGDICDKELLLRLTKGCDAVINFAAESHVDKSILSSREFMRTNVIGTENLLNCSHKNDVNVFLQISTDEVYGTISSGSWNEDSPLLPNSPYSASKASADLIARSYFRTYDLDIRITRCSNNYGPFQHPEKIIPLFVTNLLQDKKVPIYGNGQNIRDWIHVDDHCVAIAKVLTKGSSGNIYNIGGGMELTNIDLARILLQYFDRDESWIDWVPDRLGHDYRYSVDSRKAFENLDYEPKVSFNDGIKSVLSWYESNTEWWMSRKQSG